MKLQEIKAIAKTKGIKASNLKKPDQSKRLKVTSTVLVLHRLDTVIR